MSKEIWYRCEACNHLNKHIDMYNEQYCYDCIDLNTYELTTEAKEKLKIKHDKELNWCGECMLANCKHIIK